MEFLDKLREKDELRTKISKEEAGLRLDLFLAARFTYQSRSNWRKVLEEGKILVQGKKTKPSHIVKEGEEILYLPGEVFEPPVQKEFRILYEDDRYFALEKPGDLPIHAAGRYRKNNLVDIVESDPRFTRPFLIHRLDRETSGVVVFGKDKEAASRLSELFAQRKVHKIYAAYVWGEFPRNLRTSGYLSTDLSSKIRKKRRFVSEREKNCPTTEDMETSLTSFRRVGTGTIFGEKFSKVFCFPKTGRLHQIRATLCSLGFPLLGDKIYGKEEDVFLEFIEGKNPDLIYRLGMSRQALHSNSISFVHPFTNCRIRIYCPSPGDFPE